MRRFKENVLFQKLRRHHISEQYESTTTVNRAEGTTESRHSTSRDEYSEEKYYTTGSAGAKPLHFTQSLQDTFGPIDSQSAAECISQHNPSPSPPRFSKEFPPLHREPRPRHSRPTMREEQREEISEQEQGDHFLRRHQRKLYQLREQTIGDGGIGEQQQNGNSGSRWIDRGVRSHGSLPPLNRRPFPFSSSSSSAAGAQLSFDLVLDRYPPQLVQSVHHQDDAAERQKQQLQRDSRGFSPFPVFGPFDVSARRPQSVPRTYGAATEQQQKEQREDERFDKLGEEESSPSTAFCPSEPWPQQEFQHRQQQTAGSSSFIGAMASSSGDEWQSAYEFLPMPNVHNNQQQQQGLPEVQLKQQKSSIKTTITSKATTTTFGRHEAEEVEKQGELPEENIQHTFHLYKFGADANAKSQCSIRSTASTSTGDNTAALFRSALSISAVSSGQSNAKNHREKLSEQRQSTISEQQANEEVRALTRSGYWLSSSLTKSEGTEGPREVALPEKIHFHGQPIKVEISGPVHFLHATNMNLGVNGTAITGANPCAPVGESSTSIRIFEKNGIHSQQRVEVISPPLERYIEQMCDLTPIMAEIGETIRRQGQAFSPLGNLKREGGYGKWMTQKRTTFTYRVDSSQQQKYQQGIFAGQGMKRSGSTPYLVESTSHCHLARVTEISQEWRVDRPPELGNCIAVVVPSDGSELEMVEKHLTAAVKEDHWKIEMKSEMLNGGGLTTAEGSTMMAREGEKARKRRRQSQELLLAPYNQEERHWVAPETHQHYYATLQAPNRRRTSRDEMLQINRHLLLTGENKRAEDELGKVIDRQQYEALQKTLAEVQRELDSASEYNKWSKNSEVERIERAILAISERLQRPHEPVSKAQAEAKEELLRVKLAQMILNLDPDFRPLESPVRERGPPVADDGEVRNVGFQPKKLSTREIDVEDYGEALRAPIGLLREKLSLLEHRLVDEEESSIRSELRQINATPPLLRSGEQKRRQESLSQRSEEIARMTPLIGLLRHKLMALDQICQKDTQKQANISRSGRLTPYEERKTVHELLIRINTEIETIHQLCRKEDVKDRLDTVLAVLKKVASSVDRIMETLDNVNSGKALNAIKDEERKLNSEKERETTSSMLEQAVWHIEEGQRKIERDEEKKGWDPGLDMPVPFQPQPPPHSSTKKTPPKVPPKRRSLTSSIDERLGPLYSIVEEQQQQPQFGDVEQRVNAVEVSAYLSRAEQIGPRVNAFIPVTSSVARVDSQKMFAKKKSPLLEIFKKQNSIGHHHSFTPPPRIVCQQEMLLMSNSMNFDDEGPVPIRLGPCPISYLEKNRQQQMGQQISEPHNNMSKHNSSNSNNNGPLPTKNRGSAAALQQQKQKYLQLSQQHYYRNSLEDNVLSLGDEEEESQSVSMASSAMDLDSSSLSVPILFKKKSSVSSAPARETAILTDEESEREENCTETFLLRRRRKHAVLNAIIYPEQSARVRARFHGNDFLVDVERVSECGRDSVVMVSEEFHSKKVQIRSGSPVRQSTIMEELDRLSSSSGENASGDFVDAHTRMAVSINAKSDYDSVHVFLEEVPWGQIGVDVRAPPTPAVGSPSSHGQLLAIPEMDDRRSARSLGMASSVDSAMTGRDSVLKQISVTEGGMDETVRSLRSSRRSSQKSLASGNLVTSIGGTTTLLVGGQEEEEDIPAYVIKVGSTASITCELNSDCVDKGTKVKWFRGQNEQILALGGKFEQISQEYMEILVIMDVGPEDGQLYSVKINGELFPVAYLIIIDEQNDELESSTPSGQTVVGLGPEPQFLTAPQTQFVLQGETAIISVSMNRSNLNVVWHKDGQMLDAQGSGQSADGGPRVWLESTTTGWYRIIVNEVQFADQGFYHAQLGDKFTSVQLIVEERIDEREVQVSSAETDDEDLGDYLVPIGSTATIACELENVSFGYRLHWQRDHRDLDARIASGDGKFEHVVNGIKHYLIIHCAQPEDSGVYSVRIGDAKFKVAQITISTEQSLAGAGSSGRMKRISSQSLSRMEERERELQQRLEIAGGGKQNAEKQTKRK